MKKYIIGIDGGGTKTHILLANKNKDIINEGTGGDANIHSQSEENIKVSLDSLIKNILKKSNISPADIEALCIGCAGAGRDREKDIIKNILNGILPGSKITVVNDAETAFLANTEQKDGILLISGTGSVCFGYKNGEEVRAGGWGHILGDEGSGYHIALKALNSICKSHDKIESPTILTEKILEYLNLSNPVDLIKTIYGFQSKKEIAAMSYLVDEAYADGDKTAGKILENAAHELFLITKSVYEKLDINIKGGASIVTVGSVINKSAYLFDCYAVLIENNLRGINIIKGMKSPAYGALKKIGD